MTFKITPVQVEEAREIHEKINKIEAIKYIRRAIGCGLKESKEFVESDYVDTHMIKVVEENVNVVVSEMFEHIKEMHRLYQVLIDMGYVQKGDE